MKKMTQTEIYAILKEVVEGVELEQKDEIVEFLDSRMEQLAKKAEKAAQKRADGPKEDLLADKIFAMITEDLVTLDELTAKIGDEKVTKRRVSARVAKMVREGKVAKETVKVGSSRVVAYKLVTA